MSQAIYSPEELAREFGQFKRNLEKYGLVPVFKKIMAAKRNAVKAEFRGHKTPDGKPWKKKWRPPEPKIGARARFISSTTGKQVYTEIKSKKQLASAKALFRKFHGSKSKGLHALFRPRKPNKVRKLFDKLTAAVVGKNASGVISISKFRARYGFTPGTSWIEKLQFGGRYKGGIVPKRTIMAWTKREIYMAEHTILEFVVKHTLGRER